MAGGSLQRPDGILITGSPYAKYQRVTVTFPSTPDTDTVIPYTGDIAANPEDVEYFVVKQDRAGSIYNDQSATRKPWQQGYVVLRSSVGSLSATILLTAPRNIG